MRLAWIFILTLPCAVAPAQEPWKNVYSEHAWAERDKWQKADELINLLHITEGSLVADVGSHEGYMTFKLASKVGHKGVVYAVDLDAGRLAKVQKRAQENGVSHIRVIKGLPGDPKLPVNKLDAVIILDTYHEIKDHEAILEHVRISLKPGGRLLICDPIAESRRHLSRSEQERKHELAMTFAIGDLRKAGFEVVYQKDDFVDRKKQKGDTMWVVVAEKN